MNYGYIICCSVKCQTFMKQTKQKHVSPPPLFVVVVAVVVVIALSVYLPFSIAITHTPTQRERVCVL